MHLGASASEHPFHACISIHAYHSCLQKLPIACVAYKDTQIGIPRCIRAGLEPLAGLESLAA